ncbi:MAG: alpha-ketoacid dehydrogenase subunit beta [Gaiellales bacterium]
MSTAETTYRDALNAALHRAMHSHPETLVFGEDVAAPGGVFGVTRGLADEFGDRVFDTPISENAILGAALGASLVGRRPVVEIMWADFLFVGLDQLVNGAANVRWLTEGRMTAPLTVRTQQGALTSSSAQHSRCVEAMLCHVPGLKVGMPSNPADAYAMLLAAIADDDPASGIVDRAIYDQRGEIDADAPVEAAAGARVVRRGADVTVVALSRMVGVALRAAELLAAEGIDAEVVDPRWLSPFDWDTVEASIAKTTRLVVVHEAVRTCGFGAEVAALAAERGFWHLDGPVVRVTAPDCPKPSAPSLEAVAIPDAERVARGVRRAMAGAPDVQESA